ncbi:MAG: hypothetical protein JW730_14970 [Anaerolineales bacterium]|nr:hypothetical protein [Anaerolineales bacterium]
MKTVVISSRSKTLRALLKQARKNGLILQSPEGERFVLAPIGDWQVFDVGESEDFAEEVKATSQNKELIKFLKERHTHGKRILIKKVRERLGLDQSTKE